MGEAGDQVGAFANVLGELRVDLRDVTWRSWHHVRYQGGVFGWDNNLVERSLVAVAALQLQIRDLNVAIRRCQDEITLAAVNLPMQVQSAGDPTAIENGRHGTALQAAGN